MSGGYFDYNQFQLSNIAEDLRELLNNPVDLEFVENKESLIKEVDKLIQMLDYSYQVIHQIDYFLSDDISEESMWKRINTIKKDLKL